MSDWPEIIEAVRRRRDAAIAQHAAELAYLDGIEALAQQAAALREPVVAAEREMTWTEIWRSHPAGDDFFAKHPDAFAEERALS
jgi:hypothetical protein